MQLGTLDIMGGWPGGGGQVAFGKPLMMGLHSLGVSPPGCVGLPGDFSLGEAEQESLYHSEQQKTPRDAPSNQPIVAGVFPIKICGYFELYFFSAFLHHKPQFMPKAEGVL